MKPSLSVPSTEFASRIKNSSILGAIPLPKLRRLARSSVVVRFGKGETVVRRGDRGDGLYLLLDGAVVVSRGRRTLAWLGAGQAFGEMSLFDSLPRSADVVTSEPSTMLFLSRSEFLRFADREPKVFLSLMEAMSQRLRAAYSLMAEWSSPL